MNGFTIEKAQQLLDERNGQFELLNFDGVRSKNKTKCRKCGYVWNVSTDSLYRNNTRTNGCPNCLKIDFEEKRKAIERERLKRQEDKPINKRNKRLLNAYKTKELNFFYFLGLLFSDGSFDLNKSRIVLAQNEKNNEILFQLQEIYGTKVYCYGNGVYYIDFVAKELFKEIIEKYGITNNKTYVPCDLTSLSGKELIAFIIGFIDGDGSIGRRTDSKNPKIVIKLHKSWENNLNFMSKKLYNYFDISYFPKSVMVKKNRNSSVEYATVTWGNSKIIAGLYDFILENNLIHLKRKWEKLKESDVNES